jgi:methylase of polypeptide subunit release factors
MTLHVRGRKLDLVYCEEVYPTVFSLFLASALHIRRGEAASCDLGTGTGILAIALARSGMEKVTAVDHSMLACELTEENARRNGVADRIEVVHAEFEELELSGLDLVICNPPTMPSTSSTPGFASGGEDPLGVVRTVAANLGSWLGPSGRAQIALSSLVTPEALEIFAEAGFVSARESDLLAPFRPFYTSSYSSDELSAFLAEGRAVRTGSGDLRTVSELITVYEMTACAHVSRG